MGRRTDPEQATPSHPSSGTNHESASYSRSISMTYESLHSFTTLAIALALEL